MNVILFIGIGASILTAVAMVPQLVKTVKEKRGENVSLVTLTVLILGTALWTLYGILKADWVIVASNGFSLLINLTILLLNWKYKT